jgi:hypothetical protein
MHPLHESPVRDARQTLAHGGCVRAVIVISVQAGRGTVHWEFSGLVPCFFGLSCQQQGFYSTTLLRYGTSVLVFTSTTV